ncbi:threonine synthase [Geranomyces variabilis]|uniref:threonine synthase n=1 Tax=Geranomyces variabilis TaxID=109894 RepID=A0AAD5XNQ5_9FUNG|nr:threonine synthase [Geranomyces variabilis]
MLYRSTRGHSSGLSFEDAVFAGLAPDGGLYVPHDIPTVTPDQLAAWKDLSFPDLATSIFRLFIAQDEIPDADLADIVRRSFATFSSPDVTPLAKLPNVDAPPPPPPSSSSTATTASNNSDLANLYVLELFHGPTFAFKDVALQVLGNFFEYFLERKNRAAAADKNNNYGITVLGATSGDTGGAAIYGLRGKNNVDVFILHPKGRISDVQRQQMTSVLDPNVHNIAVEGTFDDCQDIVKAAFSDQPFRTRFHLAAVNSINWARILAQTSYYFHSYFALVRRIGDDETARVQYCVPTGNFGDVLAGYYAVRMGLPIARLIVATNENDILHRFFQTGTYEKKRTSSGEEKVKATLSPAMDILVSSNFERLLWYLARGDGRSAAAGKKTSAEEEDSAAQNASKYIVEWMNALKTTGGFTVPADLHTRARELFDSFCTSDAMTTDAIRRYYHHRYTPGATAHYVLDPHTAVGVVAAEQIVTTTTTASISTTTTTTYTVCLSTASPGKFPDAVLEAINDAKTNKPQGFKPIAYADFAPPQLVALKGLPTRCVDVTNDGGDAGIALEKVRAVLEGVVGAKFPKQ